MQPGIGKALSRPKPFSSYRKLDEISAPLGSSDQGWIFFDIEKERFRTRDRAKEVEKMQMKES